jgi:hypothetical protein
MFAQYNALITKIISFQECTLLRTMVDAIWADICADSFFWHGGIYFSEISLQSGNQIQHISQIMYSAL